MDFWIAAGSRIVEAAALVMAADGARSDQLPYPADSPAASLQAAGDAGGTFIDLGTGGSERVIARSADGLFYVSAAVNGVAVRFLVDTGATTIVLTAADAARAGVLPGPEEFHHQAATAGGNTAMARVRLARVGVGQSERRGVDAAITSAGLGVSLLGQSWLSQMGSMTIAGDRMVLRDNVVLKGAVPAQFRALAPEEEGATPLVRQSYAEFDFRGRRPRGADIKKRLRIAPEPQHFLRA